MGCEENRRLKLLVVDAQEHVHFLRDDLAWLEDIETAEDIANRREAKQKAHEATCPTCQGKAACEKASS